MVELTASGIAASIITHFDRYERLPFSIERMPVDVLILTLERLETTALLLRTAEFVANYKNQLVLVLDAQEERARVESASNRIARVITRITEGDAT